MGYSDITKKRAKALKDKGYTNNQVAKELNISLPTVNRWFGKNTIPNSIDTIKSQIETVADLEPTESNLKKLSMLTKSLDRISKYDNRIQKPTKETKKIILEDIESYKDRVIHLLFDYQKEFLDDSSQFRIVLKARQIGFSYVSSLDALLGALACRNQLFLSASEEQALILMRYLEGWAEKLGIEFDGDSTHEKRLKNGATIKCLAHNFRTAQGFTGDIWLDEFAWYPNPKKMWHSIVPSIGAVDGRLTILSTPFEEHSLFYELYFNDTKYYMFSRHRIDIYRAMSDGLKFDIETMRALFDSDTWASAYECQFIDDESALLPISQIKSCVDNRINYYTPSSTSRVTSGYDIGRTKDISVLAVVEVIDDRYRLPRIDAIPKATFDEQKAILINFLSSYINGVMKIDKTGIGMNLAENIQTLFRNRVEGVYFTAGTKERLALNLKKIFEEKKIVIPNDPILISDLHSIKRKAGQKGFLYDSDRNEYGHADRFWALALALSFFDDSITTFNHIEAKNKIEEIDRLDEILNRVKDFR